MALPAGALLGPYEIVAPIGSGGMGEVYRARDRRLWRDVALKVLPRELAEDAARRQRFEQEARAVAALNHPNIVAIYDIGENYFVQELVDGEPLPDNKPVGLRRTIELAGQIADALAAAHARGITHRDLKPGNIMVTRDGRAKILDFGIAKVSQGPMGRSFLPSRMKARCSARWATCRRNRCGGSRPTTVRTFSASGYCYIKC